MAEKIKLKAASSRSGSALDTGMAAFAAAAVAFVISAMPPDLFSSLVGAAGIPVLIPTAQPPLGDTARIATAAAAATATFLAVRLLLCALGNAPVPRRAGDAPNAPPRLRKADMHPDAPARTPILAGRELGVPLDEMSVGGHSVEAADLKEVEAREAPAPDLPAWLPEPGAKPVAMPFWMAEDGRFPFVVEAGEDELVLDRPAPADLFISPEHRALDEFGRRLPGKQALEHESIEKLVQRFETGLGRKRGVWAGAPASEADKDLEERLRGAISDLRKIARG